MTNKISIYLQQILPQHWLTHTMGRLAEIRVPWLKNRMIKSFIKKYKVDMSAALIENPENYETFNQFFIRKLKPELRPLTREKYAIASPVDGAIAQIGKIQRNQLLQAKKFYFDLTSLLGGDTQLAETFFDGSFATLYLAPKDYHRIHMPLSGKLIKTLFVPGQLFSVNQLTSEYVPNIFSRNERLITLFDTPAGPMAVILVGAIIVGSIQTVWMKEPVRSKQPQSVDFTPHLTLHQGEELGYFKLGSTVILLFTKTAAEWSKFDHNQSVRFGELLGHYSPPN